MKKSWGGVRCKKMKSIEMKKKMSERKGYGNLTREKEKGVERGWNTRERESERRRD